MGEIWATQFFIGIHRRHAEPAIPQIAELQAQYRPSANHAHGIELKIRQFIQAEMPQRFAIAELHGHFPEINRERLRALLGRMRDAGELSREGHGRASRWIKLAKR